MFTCPQGLANRLPRNVRRAVRPGRTLPLPRSVKLVALAVSLVVSALLTAAALRSPDHHWLAWISFLPLFVAVQWLGCPVPSRGGGRTGGMAKDRREDGSDQAVMLPGDPWPWATCDGGLHGQAGSLWSRMVSYTSHHTPRPGFHRIRRLAMPPGRPSIAGLAGAFWGGCLYVFCTAGPTSAVNGMGSAIALSACVHAQAGPSAPALAPSGWLLALLIVIPAVYVGLAARPARAIGFNLLTLALGWTLVETVLHLHNVFGPHDGLLTASQGEGQYLHWLTRLLAYVCTAFLVACANASLVGILSCARLSFPPCRSLAGSPDVVGRLPSQAVSAIQSWTLRQAYPRAPPIPVAPVS